MTGNPSETPVYMFSSIQNNSRYASQAVVLRLSKIHSTLEMQLFETHVDTDFFHCFSVWNYIPKFGKHFCSSYISAYKYKILRSE